MFILSLAIILHKMYVAPYYSDSDNNMLHRKLDKNAVKGENKNIVTVRYDYYVVQC